MEAVGLRISLLALTQTPPRFAPKKQKSRGVCVSKERTSSEPLTTGTAPVAAPATPLAEPEPSSRRRGQFRAQLVSGGCRQPLMLPAVTGPHILPFLGESCCRVPFYFSPLFQQRRGGPQTLRSCGRGGPERSGRSLLRVRSDPILVPWYPPPRGAGKAGRGMSRASQSACSAAAVPQHRR